MSWRLRRGPLGVVVCGVLIAGLAGCGQRGQADDKPPATPAGQATSATPSETPASPPPVPERPKVPGPADRNPAAVSAALTGLDACALLGRARTKVPGLSPKAELDPLNAHYCLLSDRFGETQASVGIGDGLAPDGRFGEQLLTVAGAKAYFAYYGIVEHADTKTERCRVYVPVSFHDGIAAEVELLTGKPRPTVCRQAASAVAAEVIAGVARPEAFRNRLPKAYRDACVVLADALGEPLRYPDFIHRGSVDDCRKKTGKDSVGVSIGNSRLPSKPDRTLRIGGRPVAVSNLAECTLSWSDGRSGAPGSASGLLVVQLEVDLDVTQSTQANCDRAAALAPAVMRALTKPAPKQAPQRPLTYRPAEPDTPAAGACVDLWKAQSCAPYQPVPAPRGADEVLRKVQADPNAGCAIAVDAVRKQLGPAFRPVTDRQRNQPTGPYECAFVEPSHGLTVWIRVAPPKPGYTVYPTLKIAGLPASTGSAKLSGEIDKNEREVRQDILTVDVSDQVQLLVIFEYGEPRSAVDAPVQSLDDAQLTRLRQLATGIVASYLR